MSGMSTHCQSLERQSLVNSHQQSWWISFDLATISEGDISNELTQGTFLWSFDNELEAGPQGGGETFAEH